jgi:hypothetical protein
MADNISVPTIIADNLVLNEVPILSEATRKQVLASFEAGTLYNPQGVSGIEVSDEFFWLVAGKTMEITVVSHDGIAKSGRTTTTRGGTVLATNEDVYRTIATIECGEKQAKVRLHLCDLLPLAQNGGKGNVSFGTYFPDKQTGEEQKKEGVKKYLVPKAVNRFSASEIAEYLNQ